MEDTRTTSLGLLDIFGKDENEDPNKSKIFDTDTETEIDSEETRDPKNSLTSESKDTIAPNSTKSKPNTYKKNRISKEDLEKRKIKLIKVIEANPEAIVIIKPPSKLYYNIQEVNYGIRRLSVSLLLRRTNIDLLITELREIQERLEKAATDSWFELSMVYPYASVYNIKAWRILNERFSEKKMLIENNAMLSFLIVPYSEEIGMLATTTKHMCILREKLKYYPDEKLATTLRKINDMLINETNDVLNKIKKLEEIINNPTQGSNNQ